MTFPSCTCAARTGFHKYELKSLPNVAEVATLGGMVKQYQVVLDPQKLVAYGVTQQDRGSSEECQPRDRWCHPGVGRT